MSALLKNMVAFAERRKKILGIAALVLIVLLPLLPSNPFYEELIIMIMFWATVATAWNLLGGFAGQISLGHAAFFGIGAYTSTILYLTFGVSPWIGMFAGAALSICVALIIGRACFRLTSHFFALATIAFGEVLRLLASYWRELTNGGVGLLIPHQPSIQNFIFDSKKVYAYIILVMLLAIFFIAKHLEKTRFGYYLVSLREDQNAAESLGVDTTRYKMYTLIISVFFTSIAGTFYAQYFAFIEPDIVFTSTFSIQLALLSIIGGIGTVFGPIVGACFLTPLDVFLRGWLGGVLSGLNFVVYGIILLIAVMYFPYGIVGWFKKRFGKAADTALQTTASPGTQAAPVRVTAAKKVETAEKPMMVVDSLSKSFGGLEAVKDLSFSIQRGELLGLIGPNGAGKTTVFNLISGFHTPDRGVITFKDKKITSLKMPHRFCGEGIGRTFQLVKPFQGITVLDNVMVGAFHRHRDARLAREEALEILNRIHLYRQAGSLASNLTLADRKRLELGRALATDPELLLLDEVMAGLNPKEIADIIAIIQSISDEGMTILMIEHVMKAVMALSHRIIVINNGAKIVEGPPEEISKDQRVIDAYLGEEYHAQAR